MAPPLTPEFSNSVGPPDEPSWASEDETVDTPTKPTFTKGSPLQRSKVVIRLGKPPRNGQQLNIDEGNNAQRPTILDVQFHFGSKDKLDAHIYQTMGAAQSRYIEAYSLAEWIKFCQDLAQVVYIAGLTEGALIRLLAYAVPSHQTLENATTWAEWIEAARELCFETFHPTSRQEYF